jgi:hypothetical protein
VRDCWWNLISDPANRKLAGPSENGKNGAVLRENRTVDALANAGAFSFLLEQSPEKHALGLDPTGGNRSSENGMR